MLLKLINTEQKRLLKIGDKKMATKGEKYKCEKCGLVMVADSDCSCAVCDLICFDEPLKKA